MPEQYEPDSGKIKTYQSIAVYDGSNPAYFKNWLSSKKKNAA